MTEQSEVIGADLITLTAEIVSAHVTNNTVTTDDLSGLIRTVHDTLANLGQASEPVAAKPTPAVSIRTSVKPDHLVSLIDGKKYKMLRRHLSVHGHTPQSFREMFGLPKDYPMVAASYASARREMALVRGFGRKVVTAVVNAAAGVADAVAETVVPSKAQTEDQESGSAVAPARRKLKIKAPSEA